MFDIGFWELILISVIALVVLGPERLPVAIRSLTKFIRTAKSMANNVKTELEQELKIQELQDNLRKAEQMKADALSKANQSINPLIQDQIAQEQKKSDQQDKKQPDQQQQTSTPPASTSEASTSETNSQNNQSNTNPQREEL